MTSLTPEVLSTFEAQKVFATAGTSEVLRLHRWRLFLPGL